MPCGAKSVCIRAALLLAVSTIFEAGGARAEMFEGYPDVIICRAENVRAPTYIAFVNDDGSAVYKTLGDAYATVTPDHVYHRQGVKDCDGKTLDQLVKDGQTREFK